MAGSYPARRRGRNYLAGRLTASRTGAYSRRMRGAQRSAPAAARPAFGRLLQHWRRQRERSQLDLALAADVSARHLSFVETGRAQPSRALIARLARELGLDPRAHNALLAAAGLGPAFSEHALTEPALAQVRHVLRFVLERHEPFPAVVVDRCWNVVMQNVAAVRLARALFGEVPAWHVAAPNTLRLLFHPEGLRRVVANWPTVAGAMWHHVLATAAAAPGDAMLDALLDELRTYLDGAEVAAHDVDDGAPLLLTTRIETPAIRATVLATMASLGLSTDLTVRDLRIETFVPLDDASDAALRRVGNP
jgi:transcriptional regulator with XRE-family HTH domain